MHTEVSLEDLLTNELASTIHTRSLTFASRVPSYASVASQSRTTLVRVKLYRVNVACATNDELTASFAISIDFTCTFRLQERPFYPPSICPTVDPSILLYTRRITIHLERQSLTDSPRVQPNEISPDERVTALVPTHVASTTLR